MLSTTVASLCQTLRKLLVSETHTDGPAYQCMAHAQFAEGLYVSAFHSYIINPRRAARSVARSVAVTQLHLDGPLDRPALSVGLHLFLSTYGKAGSGPVRQTVELGQIFLNRRNSDLSHLPFVHFNDISIRAKPAVCIYHVEQGLQMLGWGAS